MSIERFIAQVTQWGDAEAADGLLRRGLTLDGRIDWSTSLAPLSPAERFACDRILAEQPKPSLCAGNFSCAFRPHGRLYLLPRDEFDAQAAALTLLFHVALDDAGIRRYADTRRSTQTALEQDRAEISADLEQQGFEQVCGEIANIADHMAPLIYYIGDRCVSNFYNVGKSGFDAETTLAGALQHVATMKGEADIEPLTAVHCLHLVLRSGSYTRMEEMNSCQLSRRAVADFFETKRSFYRDECGSAVDDRFDGGSLREKAACLAAAREAIAARRRFTRLINGINLRKRESCLPLAPASACDLAAPAAQIMPTLERCLPPGTSVQQLLAPDHPDRMLGAALVPEEHASRFASCLEYMIDGVVDEAVRATNSDVGMSRSARDYRRFIEAVRGRQTLIASAWSQAEYFCHVVPSAAFLQSVSPKTVCMTLNAISARMRFNSWHYAPSYFDTAIVPGERGWFFAPRMADIADHSDQHHTGHIHALVRYSIRSPLPLRAGADVLPGFIDLRLMRQSGEPYGREELMAAIRYTEVLQFLYQCLMNDVVERDGSFVFSFGDKKWFDQNYPVRPAVSASPAAVSNSTAHPQAARAAAEALPA